MTARRPRVVTLSPFSKAWWSAWHADIAAGKATGFIAEQARRGRGRTVRADQQPLATAIGLLEPVEVSSPAFTAWAAFYEARGIRLPRPDKARVVWLPAPFPPERAAA